MASAPARRDPWRVAVGVLLIVLLALVLTGVLPAGCALARLNLWLA